MTSEQTGLWKIVSSLITNHWVVCIHCVVVISSVVLAVGIQAGHCAPGSPDHGIAERQDGICLKCHPDMPGIPCRFVVKEQGTERRQGLACPDCHTVRPDEVSAQGEVARPSGNHFPDDSGLCLACHPDADPGGLQSAHGVSRRVHCRDCHTLHSIRREDQKLPKGHLSSPEAQLCSHCHFRAAGRFQLHSHHDVESGQLRCSSCHRPHQERILTLSRVSVTTFCGECHPAQAANFYFHSQRHFEGMVGCLDCHDPHGSSQPRLLKEPRSLLCRRCHQNRQ